MRTQFYSIKTKNFPHTIPEDLLTRLSENIIEREGFLTTEIAGPLLGRGTLTKIPDDFFYNPQSSPSMVYYLGKKSIATQSVESVLSQLTGLSYEKTSKMPFLVCVTKVQNIPIVSITTLSGTIGQEEYERITHNSSILLKSALNQIGLTKNELMLFLERLLEEGAEIRLGKTNLSTSKLTIEHPRDIFKEADMPLLQNAVQLESKIKLGDWETVVVHLIKEKYAISLTMPVKERETLKFHFSPIRKKNETPDFQNCLNDFIRRVWKIKRRKIRGFSLQTQLGIG